MNPEELGNSPEQEETRPQPTAQERAARDDALSGYNRMRGARAAETPATPAPTIAPTPTPAPEPAAETSATPPADSQPDPAAAPAAPAGGDANASAAPAEGDRIAALTTMLGDLKGQVAELAKGGSTGAEIRKLQGEIGSINRSLKQLAKSDDAPADLAAALAKAEKLATDYPEIGRDLADAMKPIVGAIKALQAAAPEQPEPEEIPPAPQPTASPNPEKTPDQIVNEARQQAAIDALNELHPDRLTLNKSPEFNKWLTGKTPEYQQRFKTSWNPAVVARVYDEYKASVKRRESNQQRLDAAVTPQGTAAVAPSSAPTDKELAKQGYARYSKRL